MIDTYILGPGHIIIPCDDLVEFGRFMVKHKERIVAQEFVAEGIFVSTVFVGVDYNFGSGPPLVFETAVNSDYGWDEREFYATWEDAEAGHRAVVQRLRERMYSDDSKDQTERKAD